MQPLPERRFRYATFSGSVHEFLMFLGQHLGAEHFDGLCDPADYDWEITRAIARHPAGKRLGPIDGLHDSNANGFRDGLR